MSRFPRLLRRLGLAVALILVASASGVGVILWMTLPPGHADVTIPALSAPARITFDADGIARIRAANATDAAAALGYAHARDRMFAMDLMRRLVSGRLSEIAGPATLRLDRRARVMGFARRAEAELALLSPDMRGLLDAYSAGVNAWIARRGRFSAPEFLLFGTPEPWTPIDCLLWGKLMADSLSADYRIELSRAALADHLPPEKIDQLWPNDDLSPAPTAFFHDPLGAAVARGLAALLPRFPDRFTLPDTASDEWAVDGRHSRSGAPLLAGDPHLGLTFPGPWYLARIDTPDSVLAGATAPGVPFMVLGRNGHVAWSFTTTGADTQDLFRETVLPDGRYATPDGPRAFERHEERIRVRGGADVAITVRETRHGPVISDLLDRDGPVFALQAMNLRPANTAVAGLLALNRARDLDEAVRAAPLISTPVQNLLVADRQRIGLVTTGAVPLRRTGAGAGPVDGADGAHDWIGTASGTALPQFLDPPGSRLLNANNRTAPANGPVPVARDWPGAWRARRIRELLDGDDKFTPAAFARMQVDTVSTYARDLLPALRATLTTGPTNATSLLRDWDGDMRPDLPQPLLFNAWMAEFTKQVLARNGATDWTGPWHEFTRWLLTRPEAAASWCDGDCAPLLRSSLAETLSALSRRYGRDPAAWRWGEAHRAEFAHPLLGRLPLLGWLTTARVPVAGDDTTLWRSGSVLGDLDARHGAAFRAVYDLSDLDRSLFMAAPGQSGNPLAATAYSLLDRWRSGGTLMLGPEPGPVAADAELRPGPP